MINKRLNRAFLPRNLLRRYMHHHFPTPYGINEVRQIDRTSNRITFATLFELMASCPRELLRALEKY
jgi:hypothetical protein